MNEERGSLSAVDTGYPKETEQLLPLVYEELRRLAAQKLAHEKPGQTLQTTELVHEAYLRLLGGPAAAQWQSRAHFFAAAAETMRRILIDRARGRRAEKRGGRLERHELGAVDPVAPRSPVDLLALDEALSRLEALDPDKAVIVKLRYFVGLNEQETAQALGLSRSTVQRHWRFARAWLLAELEHDQDQHQGQERSAPPDPENSAPS
jgi:RNA polymerase sigma factor (TIGR02999 family)